MKKTIGSTVGLWCCTAILACSPGFTQSTEPADPQSKPAKPTLDIYGFAMTDAGYDFKQVDPNWFDVVRPTKLPSKENEFGADGNTYFSVRQTRFGAKSEVPTKMGALKTIFEFELFGTGANAGQTTFRLRHAYGELGQFGAGQTWSPFMDIDVFPNSVEYWGPNGMVFFRNVQFRWMPVQGDSRVTLALERPGASADQGQYRDRIELQDVRPHFPMPDVSGEARLGRKWGYIEAAGILRRIKWVDVGTDQFDLSGGVWGWGINFSSNLKVYKKGVVKLQLVYGKGIQNYMNDAPADVGPKPNPGNPKTPVTGEALPLLGIVAFYDLTWSDKFSSTVGYSRLDIDNSSSQADNAFRSGQYAVTNLLYYPVKDVMVGGEFQWGHRKNFRDGWSVPDYRIQFSFKYNFSFHVLGN
jgi:DcaP outer membrane protein